MALVVGVPINGGVTIDTPQGRIFVQLVSHDRRLRLAVNAPREFNIHRFDANSIPTGLRRASAHREPGELRKSRKDR